MCELAAMRYQLEAVNSWQAWPCSVHLPAYGLHHYVVRAKEGQVGCVTACLREIAQHVSMGV